MDDAEEYLIPAMREILKVNPDVRVMLSPWTAPPWMKTIEIYFGSVNGIGARLDPKYFSLQLALLLKLYFLKPS